MNDFSSAGPTSPDGWEKPDLAASGRSVVSLAAPGSTIWNQYPSARIGSANFVGSGTSFSTAITSGAVALVQAANQASLSPNQVKARLLATASPGPVGDPFVDGHGALDAYAAARSGPMDYHQSAASLAPIRPGATVSLSPTRPVDTWNTSLWSGVTWNQPPDTGLAWNGLAWNGGAWNGLAWNNDDCTGLAWNGSAWNGSAWNGSSWNGSAWDGAAWNGSAWNGSAWSGLGWN
jgi:serine protease AprX